MGSRPLSCLLLALYENCVPTQLTLMTCPGAVYFVQGILGLSRLGVTYFYKDEFHLDPASVRSFCRLTVVAAQKTAICVETAWQHMKLSPKQHCVPRGTSDSYSCVSSLVPPPPINCVAPSGVWSLKALNLKPKFSRRMCSAAQVALLTSISAAPWVVKPLYGFLSDTVPILGYRRRSYLVICGVLGAHASYLLTCGSVSLVSRASTAAQQEW